ncbi:MAG: hypothetical protein JXA44_13275, partial [Methanospirillaceae archaeon]|nr:hypothetical protein [Methanospirillaceae archaeon]
MDEYLGSVNDEELDELVGDWSEGLPLQWALTDWNAASDESDELVKTSSKTYSLKTFTDLYDYNSVTVIPDFRDHFFDRDKYIPEDGSFSLGFMGGSIPIIVHYVVGMNPSGELQIVLTDREVPEDILTRENFYLNNHFENAIRSETGLFNYQVTQFFDNDWFQEMYPDFVPLYDSIIESINRQKGVSEGDLYDVHYYNDLLNEMGKVEMDSTYTRDYSYNDGLGPYLHEIFTDHSVEIFDIYDKGWAGWCDTYGCSMDNEDCDCTEVEEEEDIESDIDEIFDDLDEMLEGIEDDWDTDDETDPDTRDVTFSLDSSLKMTSPEPQGGSKAGDAAASGGGGGGGPVPAP